MLKIAPKPQFKWLMQEWFGKHAAYLMGIADSSNWATSGKVRTPAGEVYPCPLPGAKATTPAGDTWSPDHLMVLLGQWRPPMITDVQARTESVHAWWCHSYPAYLCRKAFGGMPKSISVRKIYDVFAHGWLHLETLERLAGYTMFELPQELRRSKSTPKLGWRSLLSYKGRVALMHVSHCYRDTAYTRLGLCVKPDEAAIREPFEEESSDKWHVLYASVAAKAHTAVVELHVDVAGDKLAAQFMRRFYRPLSHEPASAQGVLRVLFYKYPPTRFWLAYLALCEHSDQAKAVVIRRALDEQALAMYQLDKLPRKLNSSFLERLRRAGASRSALVILDNHLKYMRCLNLARSTSTWLEMQDIREGTVTGVEPSEHMKMLARCAPELFLAKESAVAA